MRPKDSPGVIAPPPLIVVTALALGLVLDRIFPAFVIRILLTIGERVLIGLPLVAAGIGLVVLGIGHFRRIGTNAEPWKPTLMLATTGIYRYLRNPMYVGMGLALLGCAIALASDWMLVMLIPAAIVLHFGVVLREERYLTARFGEPYRHYRQRVPRYGYRIFSRE